MSKNQVWCTTSSPITLLNWHTVNTTSVAHRTSHKTWSWEFLLQLATWLTADQAGLCSRCLTPLLPLNSVAINAWYHPSLRCNILLTFAEHSYNLRRRRHDYKLVAKTRTLNINNFIICMLYKNSYWHTLISYHLNNAYLSLTPLNEYCIV